MGKVNNFYKFEENSDIRVNDCAQLIPMKKRRGNLEKVYVLGIKGCKDRNRRIQLMNKLFNKTGKRFQEIEHLYQQS